MFKKVVFGALVALCAAPTVAQAEGQRCLQFDGTVLTEFQIVYPHELVTPNGYIMPVEATGTTAGLNPEDVVYPLPCAPVGTPVEVVEVTQVSPPAPPIVLPDPEPVVVEPAPVAFAPAERQPAGFLFVTPTPS